MRTQTTLPLNTLKIDPMNVRSIGRGDGDPELKASIKANGVKLPLIVRPNADGHRAYVGGRRLEQLQVLAAEGVLPADHPVPVIIEDVSDAVAREISLTENVIRRAMHPVDEYRAFVSLQADKETPLDVDSIAERFGLAKRRVEQRLALGRLHPKVLNAWRDGRIGQETAQAFTLCSDLKSQARLLDRMGQNGTINAWMIKNELKLGREHVGRLIGVIGKDAYEARGGKVQVDLFGDDHQVSDPDLVRAMLQERVDVQVQSLREDGWSWVIAGRPDDAHLHGSIEPRLKPSDDERADLARLKSVMADDAMDWEAQRAASQAVDDLRDAIALRSYSLKQKAESGCFVIMDSEGVIDIHHGKTRPVQARAIKKAGAAAISDRTGQKAEAKSLSVALQQRLAVQLAAATQAAILADKHPTKLSGLLAKVVANLIVPERPGSTPAGLITSISSIRGTITPRVLNAALRKHFEAEDYFASAPKAVCLVAVTEALSVEDARRLSGRTKTEITKFCIGSVAKTGWLPPELRCASYEGPGGKACKTRKAA